MRVVCEREPTPGGGWLQAKSDPSMHGGNQDRDGDGKGKSRKVVGAFEVDLTVSCLGN